MIRTTLLAGATATLLATAAGAADLPYRKGPPVYAPPVFTWTGVYFGTHTGYDFSDHQTIKTICLPIPPHSGPPPNGPYPGSFGPSTVRSKYSGFANIGGNIGYNYQFTPGYGFVVGVQGDFDWTDVGDDITYRPHPGFLARFHQRLDFLATVTGKVGYAFDRFLVYGLGGAAFGNVDYRDNLYIYNYHSPAYSGHYNDWETGYAYGGGVEYAFAPDSFFSRYNLLSLIGIKTAAVTIKAEYIHYDLGSHTVRDTIDKPIFGNKTYFSRFETEGNFIRAGLNYKF